MILESLPRSYILSSQQFKTAKSVCVATCQYVDLTDKNLNFHHCFSLCTSASSLPLNQKQIRQAGSCYRRYLLLLGYAIDYGARLPAVVEIGH